MKYKKIIFISTSLIFILAIFFLFTNFYRLNFTDKNLDPNQPTSLEPSVKGETTNNRDNILPDGLINNNLKSDTNTPTFKIPVLMYHYIRDYNDSNDKVGNSLSVSPQKFTEQLKWLKDHNYQTVDFTYLEKPYSVSYKPIILTFDDGYKDAFTEAYSKLKDDGFKGIFYIIAEEVEKGNDYYANWDEIKQMTANGMIIGSHTMTHPNLTSLSDDKLSWQLSESKKTIEKRIGITITDFCYPSGKFDQRVVDKVKDIYQTATTVKNNIYDSQLNNQWEIPRLRITNQTDFSRILLQ